MAPNNTVLLRTADDVKAWCIRHDARSRELWKQQKEWDKKVEELCKEIYSKINTVDRRVMWICGAATTVGVVLGTVLTGLVTYIIGS